MPRETGGLDTASRADAGGRAFNKDRSCDKWIAYTQGLEPKDHYMELRARQLEKDREDFQLRIFELEQGIRQDQAAARDAQDARERRRDRGLTWAAIILGVILGSGQIIASLLTMAKDSAGYSFIQYLARWVSSVLR